MARQETETYVVLDAPLNSNYGGQHIALPIHDHDEACEELVALRARLVAVGAVCDEMAQRSRFYRNTASIIALELLEFSQEMRAALEGMGDGAK